MGKTVDARRANASLRKVVDIIKHLKKQRPNFTFAVRARWFKPCCTVPSRTLVSVTESCGISLWQIENPEGQMQHQEAIKTLQEMGAVICKLSQCQ